MLTTIYRITVLALLMRVALAVEPHLTTPRLFATTGLAILGMLAALAAGIIHRELDGRIRNKVV